MKIVVLQWKDESILRALQYGFEKLGHSVLNIRVDEKCLAQDILKSIEAFSPDLAVTHNFYIFDLLYDEGAQLEQGFIKRGIPLLTWYWESPRISGYYKMIRRFLYGPFPKDFLFLVVDRSHQDFLKYREIPTDYLPIGVDTNHYNRKNYEHLKSKFSFDLSYSGRPFSTIQKKVKDLNELRVMYADAITSNFQDILNQTELSDILSDEEFSFAIKSVSKLVGLLFRDPIYSSQHMDQKSNYCLELARQNLRPDVFRELEIFWSRFEFAYSWYRLNEQLWNLRPEGIRVFGGEDWGNYLLGDYPNETPFLSDLELGALFSFSKISYCPTKWTFRDGVQERSLIVLALNGFPLADDREGIWELFEKDEIDTVTSPEEMKDKVSFYLKNESIRTGYSERGHRKVLAEHNYDRRAEQMIQLARKHFFQ